MLLKENYIWFPKFEIYFMKIKIGKVLKISMSTKKLLLNIKFFTIAYNLWFNSLIQIYYFILV